MHPSSPVSNHNCLIAYNYSQITTAPVFGATPAAQKGQVLMAMSGPSKAIELALPFGKGVIAREVMIISDEPEKATLLKALG